MKKLILICVSIFMFSNLCLASGVSPTATSADCDNATLSTYSGTTNLQANWEPNKINLYWYSDDTLLDVQDSADSCFYDGALTIPDTPPTKTGYTFDGWRVRGLPDGYTKLEYIEGGKDVNAYINLGYPATTNMRTLLTASFSTSSSDDQRLFGASDQVAYAGGNPYSVDRFPSYTIIPNGGTYNRSVCKVVVTTFVDTVYQFKVNYPTIGTIGVNDTVTTANTTISAVSSRNLYVFGFNGAGTYSTTYSVNKMRLYALTIWTGDTLAHNYIPAKRNSDNALGIYDSVTGVFLTNAGTGVFIAGPVVR